MCVPDSGVLNLHSLWPYAKRGCMDGRWVLGSALLGMGVNLMAIESTLPLYCACVGNAITTDPLKPFVRVS